MDLKKLAQLLGLPDTATEKKKKKALAALAEASKEANKGDEGKKEGGDAEEAVPVANSVVLSLLGLKADAKTEDVATAIMKLSAGTGNDEVLALKEELKERNAEDMVQMALKEGKITAAQKEWAKSYALSDKEGFKSFVDKAPVIVPQGKMELKDAPADSHQDYDMEILKNCGLSKEDVEKYYKED